jgi:hypothetical protein
MFGNAIICGHDGFGELLTMSNAFARRFDNGMGEWHRDGNAGLHFVEKLCNEAVLSLSAPYPE